MAPRLVCNALALRPRGSGVQTYIRELLGALDATGALSIAAVVQDDAVGALPAGVEPLRRRRSDGAARALAGLRPVPPADLVHGLDVDLPVRTRCPLVATVHDLSVFDTPWAFSAVRARGEQVLVTASLRRADAVVAVSPFTAERVGERFGIEATPTPLAPRPGMAPPPAAAVEELRRRLDLPPSFVLHVGTIEPRKNISGLARACERLDVPLVLAGATWADVALPGEVHPLGYVDDDDLPALYAAATVVAQPSHYEGFSLPPVEAMACGAAVLSTRVGIVRDLPLRDVQVVAPGDAQGLRERLHTLLVDDAEREAARAAGQAAAASLSWAATAAATLGVYARLGLDVGHGAHDRTAPDAAAESAGGRS